MSNLPYTQKGEPTNNFFRISHKIVDSQQFKKLKPSSQILYLHFCRLRNRFAGGNSGVFFRSDKQLVEDTGLSHFSVFTARHELLKKGFLRWKQGRAHRACRYQVVDNIRAKI